MGKHLGLKAFVLLVVIFFHSFFLVPVGYAGAMGQVIDIAVARQMYRSVAPSVVAATPAGWGYAIGYLTVAGIAYYFIKSGGVTALKNWWNANPGALPDASDYPISANNYYSPTNGRWVNVFAGCSPGPACRFYNSNGTLNYQGCYSGITSQMAQEINNWLSISAPVLPTIPTDYSGQLALSQPDFPSGSVKFTPGGAAQLNGANPVGPVTPLSDADIDKMSGALGATEPENGTQPNPTAGDNALTPDTNATLPYLQQIMNYTSNLVGIKTDTGKISSNTDNLVAGQASQTTATSQMKSSLDNVAVAINNQTQIDNQMLTKLDNVAQTLDTFRNTNATQSSLSSRIGEVKDLLLTKFPFSIVGAVTSPGVVSGGTYSIPDLQFPMGTIVSVDPLANAEIASWVSWLRGLMATGMWAIFVLVMVRRVTQI